jgi:hypothetical protein
MACYAQATDYNLSRIKILVRRRLLYLRDIAGGRAVHIKDRAIGAIIKTSTIALIAAT